ncbi:hypothetical protein [Mycolicibacterium nivoides]|uniref:Uncharacterized protein n=1 Tax=Mycolicibacterium nivoides TaxID=2487344 RepID=A0ABW9LA38_9MYCO
MWGVQGTHQVVAFGSDLMRLFNSTTGETIVEATRSGDDTWVIHAEGVDDLTATDRAGALNLMPQHAFDALGTSGPNGEGYSTLIPNGLAELP